jgi:hypothetical protein
MFHTSAQQAQPNNPFQNANQGSKWQKDGYLNLYLPTEDGGKRKLGAIGLRLSNENEAKLLQWLEENPENVEKLMAMLILEYNSAKPTAGTGFLLS